jgi:hypothetical protein
VGLVGALTAITNLGFTAVILMGAAGYALTGALVLVANREAARSATVDDWHQTHTKGCAGTSSCHGV